MFYKKIPVLNDFDTGIVTTLFFYSLKRLLLEY